MKRIDINARPGLGMRLSERLRFAVKDLWKRRMMTSFNLAAVFIAVVYVVLPSFYGLSIYQYQQSVLDESLPTLIVASCPDVTDDQLRFTNERINQLASMPEAKLAFPKVELGVKFSLDSRSSIDLPIEATVSDDPGLSASRLVWGRPVQRAEPREVVIPKALFEKMGGIIHESGPTPSTVFVQVNRTVGGQAQSQTIPLEVVGIVGYQSFDKIYAPLELVQQLDQWCSSKIRSIGGASEHPKLDYPYCFAYVPKEERHRVEDEAKQLNVALRLEAEVMAYDAPPDVWLNAERDGAGSLLPETAEIVEPFGGDAHPVRMLAWQLVGREYIVMALAPDDPRWGTTATGHPPGFGQAFVRAGANGLTPGSLGPVRIIGEFNAPGAGDVYCLPNTLKWLAFEYETCPLIGRVTSVETRSLDLAARWERESPGSVTPDKMVCWDIYGLHQSQDEFRPSDVPSAPLGPSATGTPNSEQIMRTNQPQTVSRVHPVDDLLSQFRTEVPDVAYGVIHDGNVRLMDSSAVGNVIRCRFIPDQFFEFLAEDQPKGTSPKDGTVPCIQMGAGRNIAFGAGVRVAGRSLENVGTIPGSTLTLLFPASTRKMLCPSAEKSGLACWADWQRANEINGFFAHRGESVGLLHSMRPKVFNRIHEGDLESCRRWLGVDSRHCTLLELTTLTTEVNCGAQQIGSICATPTRTGAIRGNLCALPAPLDSPQEAVIEAGGYQHRLRLQHSSRLPRGMAVLEQPEFRRLVFETAVAKGALSEVGTSMAAVRLDSIYYGKARRVLESKGLRLTPFVPVREQSLLKFRVTDVEQSDGRVGEDLLRVLAMTKPTFAAAVPALPTEAELEGQIILDASGPHDPHRFDAELICGSWLTADSHNEIILPASRAEQLMRGKRLRDSIGTVVEVQFHRLNRIAASEPALRLPLKVVGVVQNDTAMVPLELLQQIALWSDGKVVFNDSRMTFETPAAIYTRRGHVRCNIHAADLTSVEPLVAKLRQIGYRTEDSLADQQGLRRLGQALSFVVGTFAFGCLLIAGKMIVVTTMMNVHTKRWEIGILKAHGMKTSSILSIFAIQGAIIGAGAFLIGGGFVAALEPMLRGWIGASFKIPMETIVAGSLWSFESAWLLAIALAAALLLSTLGVMLPAAGAAARLPVETLQRRE